MSYRELILRVNLTDKSVKMERLNMDWADDYIGGKGLAIKYLYEELEGGIDPLSSDNKLVVMTGPFTGTLVPCSGKLAIAAKSPATNTILDCSIGGAIASEIKYAGYDAIIIEGESESPVYLEIMDDEVCLKDASELWGTGSFEVELKLKERISDDISVLTIGPAGENLITYSCISTEFYRKAGRGGIGAVMGSKKLKAIAVKGTKGLPARDPKRFLEVVGEVFKEDVRDEHNLWAFTDGTAQNVEVCNSVGILPTRNFQQGTFEDYEKINSEEMKKHRDGKKGCFSCGLGCGNFTKMDDVSIEGPEYETLSVCGSNCGIGDLNAVVKFNRLCDDYGIDTISAGNVVAYAMELTEKCIRDYGIRFGDIDEYLKMPELIAYRKGIGEDLAKGVKKLSEEIGAKDFAMQVKGLEFPGYDPRGAWGMALAYATADRGACHLRSYIVLDEAYGAIDPLTIEGKSRAIVDMQNLSAVKFSTILCDFFGLSADKMALVYEVVTGIEADGNKFMKIGERINNLARLFNGREGFDRKDDKLPKRILNEVLTTGTTKGVGLTKENFEMMLEDYYVFRGWDENGMPTEEKLKELNIQ